MNAMLQQFYMMPRFRFGVMSVPVSKPDGVAQGTAWKGEITSALQVFYNAPFLFFATSVWLLSCLTLSCTEFDLFSFASFPALCSLQTMFGSLSMSERQAYNPRAWANAFRDSSGNPVNVGIQQDAEEFVNVRW